MIIDDYGDFVGCRAAVDEFLAAIPEQVLLSRIDQAGRLIVVPGR